MINATYCLCLDKRKALWPWLEHSVQEHLRLPLRKFIVGNGSDSALAYDYIDENPGTDVCKYMHYGTAATMVNHYNAYISHRKIFEEILAKGYKKVLCLEDDATFLEKRFSTIFFSPLVQDFIRQQQFDCLYLGWWMTRFAGDSVDCEEYERDWKDNGTFDIERAENNLSNRISGLHGIILTDKFIRKLLQSNYGPFDQYINERLAVFKCYYVRPKIIHVPTCYSYCEGITQERSVLT